MLFGCYIAAAHCRKWRKCLLKKYEELEEADKKKSWSERG